MSFEEVDFSGVRRVEFTKRDSATLAVGVELVRTPGQEDEVADSDREVRLERLRVRTHKPA